MRDARQDAVEAADYPGFIANRILMPMINEAIFAVMEGVGTPEAIDTVMKLGMNHPMGPLTLADFIGLDVCLAILNVLHEGFGDPKYRPCPAAPPHGRRRAPRPEVRPRLLRLRVRSADCSITTASRSGLPAGSDAQFRASLPERRSSPVEPPRASRDRATSAPPRARPAFRLGDRSSATTEDCAARPAEDVPARDEPAVAERPERLDAVRAWSGVGAQPVEQDVGCVRRAAARASASRAARCRPVTHPVTTVRDNGDAADGCVRPTLWVAVRWQAGGYSRSASGSAASRSTQAPTTGHGDAAARARRARSAGGLRRRSATSATATPGEGMANRARHRMRS